MYQDVVVSITVSQITPNLTAENNEYFLSNSFCGSEIGECHCPKVWVQGLLLDWNQESGQDRSHLKAWPGVTGTFRRWLTHMAVGKDLRSLLTQASVDLSSLPQCLEYPHKVGFSQN